MVPRAKTAPALAAELPILDEARAQRMRAEAAERPIRYALGSGEAEEIALGVGGHPALLGSHLRAGPSPLQPVDDDPVLRLHARSHDLHVADDDAELHGAIFDDVFVVDEKQIVAALIGADGATIDEQRRPRFAERGTEPAVETGD